MTVLVTSLETIRILQRYKTQKHEVTYTETGAGNVGGIVRFGGYEGGDPVPDLTPHPLTAARIKHVALIGRCLSGDVGSLL